MNRYLVCAMACVLFSVAGPGQTFGQSFLEKLTQRLSEAAKQPASPERRPISLGVTGEETDGHGVEVRTVKSNSPADLSGIRVGDVITIVNGINTRNADELAAALGRIRPGDTVEFEIRRGTRNLAIPVKFGDRPAANSPQLGDPFEPLPDGRRLDREPRLDRDPRLDRELATERSTIGVSVVDLDGALAARYELPVRQGALVNGIQSGGPADLAGLPLGAAIVTVDGRAIANSDAFVDVIRSTPPGQSVKIGYYFGDRLIHKQIRLAQLDARAPLDDRRGPSATPLEGVLGEGGRRPVLGRLGRMLDQIVEQPEGGAKRDPFAPGETIRTSPDEQVQLLQRQVDTLQRQVEVLQRRLDELERRSADFRRK